MADFELAVPGVIYVGSTGRQKDDAPEGTSSAHVVHLGAAAGWMKPRGIRQWAREVSVIRRSALSEAVRKEFGATLPQEQVAPAKMPLTSRASRESPFIAVSRNLVDKLVEKGVRVHTIGFDKISGGFYYLAEGGQSPPARIAGDLIEMVSPALEAAGDNADLDSLLEGVIDRILLDVSKGDIGEAAVELAAALPRLSTDGHGTEDCDLEGFEREAASLVSRSTPYETLARVLASRLSSTKHSDIVTVPLFGEARREKEPVISVNFGNHPTRLAARDRWLVAGAPNREITLAPSRANTVRVPTVSGPPSSSSGGNGGSRSRLPAAGAPPVPPSSRLAASGSSLQAAKVLPRSPVTERRIAPELKLGPPKETPAPAPAPLDFGASVNEAPMEEPTQLAPPVDLRGPSEAAPPQDDRISSPPAISPPAISPPPIPPPAISPPAIPPPAISPPHDSRSMDENALDPIERWAFEQTAREQAALAQAAPEQTAPAREVSPAPPPLEMSPPLPEMTPSPRVVEAATNDAPVVHVPMARSADGQIFAPTGPRGGRSEIEPEPMTQPSQRRRREMEEAQARAVRDARRLALWLVIGLIFILVAVYVIWNRS